MLTEGWDANTVTHVLGVRAFGTQLLCEQVIGRALRRQSYDLNEEGLFNVEYADVLGIPFDFTAKPVVAPPQPPRETIQVQAVRPERDALEIRFPRVEGYRVELPEERLDRELQRRLDPGADARTWSARRSPRTQGIIGEGVDLNLEHLGDMRPSTILLPSTPASALHEVARSRRRAEAASLRPAQAHRHASGSTAAICVCKGGTYPAQLIYQELADMACERITAAITAHVPRASGRSRRCSTPTTRPARRATSTSTPRSRRAGRPTRAAATSTGWSCDSDWEAEFCRVAEAHPRVRAYVKNHNLGLEVPYRYGSDAAHDTCPTSSCRSTTATATTIR